MLRKIKSAILISACLSVPVLASSQERDTDKLEDALDRIGKNPKWAAQQLKTLDSPSDKVYLAYLYMSRKVPTPNYSHKVDQLMRDAIAKAKNSDSLGEIDPTKHYHYTDMRMLLSHLRFITDADGMEVAVPASIFKNYPIAAFDAFGPYWGSTRDGRWNIDSDLEDDICQLPAVSRIKSLLEQMVGDPSPFNSGTIRYVYYRTQALSFLKASMAPQMFLPGVKTRSECVDKELNKFLEVWSNQELWNKAKFEEWKQVTAAAEIALAKYYGRRLGLSVDNAKACANTAVATINTAYLSEYPKSWVKETLADPIYRIFSARNLTLEQMRRGLNGKVLNKDQLNEALRLAILNDGQIRVIDWLLKQGAPLNAGREPALFSAVRRPEVVELLLKSGADVNEINVLGKTALFQAVQFNSLASVQKLHAAGANIKASMNAIDDSDDSKLRLDPDYNYSVGLRTPLMYATAFAGYPVIRYLLAHGSERSAVDSSGANAEKYLAENKLISKAERVKLLNMFHR